MAKLPPLGPVRMATSSIDDEYEDLVTVPEGYREKPPADLNIVEMEEIQRRYIEAATQYVNETTTGVTEEERDKLAQEYLEEIGADPNSPNRAAEAWAAENRAEDNPESVFFRSIWPKESVFPVPGSYSQTATYKERLEDRMFYNTKNALQEAEGLTEDEAIARSFQATPSRQESSGQDLVDRVTRAENLTLRPGVFQSYGEIANESALGSGVRSVAAWASSYVNPFHVGAETVAEKYYGQSRGQRWWKNRDEYFNARVVYAGHPAEKAHKDVAHPDTGQFRPWYETVEIRAHLGTASDEELETYNQNLERHNNIQSGRASFIDVLGQYIQQRDAFLKETKSAKEVGSIESAWIAQPSDWVSEWKKRSGVKLSVEEIRKDWDDIDTYPTNSQVAERVKAAIDVWKVRQEMLDSGRDGEEITKRLDRIVQSIPSDLWPDKRLRIVHANELGESSFMTRAGHVQASWVGDTAMFANPIFKALNPHDPEIDFSGLDTAFKRSAQTVVQTGSTVAQGFVRVGDWIGIDVPGSNFGQTNTALWGSEVAENFKTFFDNEELISDDPSVRKSELTRMFLSLSRRDIHVNEYLLNVPSFSEFKNEFLEVQDHPVQPPQAISIYLENPNVRYLHPAMYRIVQGAKERAKEENLELEEYVYSDDGWQTIESQLNRQKLFTLPGKIATGVFKKMGGYEGIRKDIERQTAAREAMYGPENRQVGAFLSQTLGNAMTDSRYLEDGTTITVNETGAGTFLRVGGEFAAGPISEIAMDVLFDPIMAIGDQFGAWDWDGRASDRGSVNDFWVGMDDTAVASFTGRLQEAAAGLGYDKNTELYRAFTAIGLGFDLLTPMEEMGLATMARPFVGTQRLRKIYEDMPGTRLSSDTLRASYLPNGFYGIGSLWKKVAPVEDIADYQKAVDTAKTGAAERRADTVARQGRRDLREVVFGDPELNLAKKRLKDATSRQRGFMSWRRAMPGMGPAPLTKKFGGMHDLTSMMAGELFNKNLLQGRNPLEGFGPNFRSNVFEVMRRGGIAAEDVNRVLKDSSKMRTAKFLSEAAERLDSVDDYTKGIRESASYSRLRDELEAANERNPLNYKSLEGIDVVDSLMAMIETHAVGLARIRGIEEGSKAIETYMERLLQDVESGRAVEPPSMAIASRAGEVDSAKQALVDSIPADELRTVDVDLSDEAQLNALSDAAQFEIVTAVGDKAALRSMGMDMLVTLIGRVSSKSDVGADLLGEISHRLAKEFADMPATAQSKFDDFVELLSRAEDNMLAQFSDEAALDSVRKLFDNVLEDVSERVRRARETLDDAGEAKVSAAQANAGRAQIAQSIRALAEKGFLEAGQAAVLEALVMSLPERVLRDIRLNDQIAGIAQGASARTTELLTEGGAVDRLISSVDFFGYADEIGTMKAAESSFLIGANLDEIFEAIRYKRDDNQGFRSVAIRFLSDRKNPKTGKTYTSRELSERYVDAETWMKRQEGEVFSAEKTEQLVSQFEHALDSYKRGSDRVGPRTYQFLHELGHGVAMSFLADSEIAILSKAFRDELDDFGLFRDTPYTRNFQTMTDIQFNEWFAENFAEFVITHRLPNVVATQRGAGDLLRIFNNLIERMSNWFSSWYRRDPRARTDFHPALSTLVDRLFDDKAAGMASRREVALRRATGFQVRMADEGVFSALSRQRAGLDGQYIPDLDEVEVAQDLLRMEEELPPAELRMAEKDLPVSGERAILPEELEATDARRQAERAESVREDLGDVRLRGADGERDYSLADLQRGANQPKPEISEEVSRAFFTTLGFDLEVDAAGRAVNTSNRLKIYPLKEAFGDTVEAVDRTIDDWTNRTDAVGSGWKFEVFGPVFDDKGQVTGFKPPNFREKSYPQKTAWIYQPMELQGSFGDYAYTKAWRVTHEIAHGLVNEILTSRYGGEGRRAGALGIESVGPGGRTHPPLSLADALRALEWEHETFLMQRRIIEEDFGIKITDAQFNEEYALNMSDAAFRVLTGQFTTPGQLGVIPKNIPAEEAFERAKTLVRQAAAEMGLDMRGSFDVEVTVAAVGIRPDFIDSQLLMSRANEARKKRDAATNAGTRRMYQRQLDTANRRLQALLEPDLKKALTEGLDPDLVQITNLTEAGDFERSLGVFANYAPEDGFYVTIKGPRDIILGRVAEYSRAYSQDAMLVRERIKTVEIDETKSLIEQISFDDKGVQRGATARIVIPGAFEGRIAEAIVKSIAEHQTGATIRLDTLKDGRGVIELVHVPEWIRKDLKNYEEAISIETFSDIVDNVSGDIRSYAKKKKLGDIELAFEQESVYTASHSRGASDAATNTGFYEYWIERGRKQLREQGREAAPLFERAEEGVGPGAAAPGPRLQPGGERPTIKGSNPLLDIPGATERIGPEIRRILNERDVLDSGHLSEELAAEFDLSSEVLGGTPHTIVDSEIDSGLKQRVFNSEITSYQAEILKERLGSASPLEDISTDTKFTVERIVETPEGTRIERSEVSGPVYPMLKATGFGGEQGMKVLIPGGKEGVFSFADVQYLARRPIEMITDEAAGKWWSDVGEGLFGKPDTLGNFDEIIEQYKEAYTAMVEEMYDKLHSGYGLEAKRPNVKDFFSGNRFINNDVRADWAQQMEVHLMDVASQYVFAFLSMQTNLLDNQMFAAVARPRNMRDLADMVGRGRTATANKGSSLTRNEANHILGFSVTIGAGVLEGRFGKKQILLDVETEVLPIIEIRDWTKPNGPLIRVQSVDIAPLNADKIAGKARKALGRYVKFKRQVEKIESRIPTIKDAAKRRRAKSQLKKAIKEMEAADMAHRAVLNSVSSTDVIALTGDIVLSSPADTVKLLEMYDMMYEDFVKVQRGDLKQSFFERYPDETWDAFSDRVSSMVPGMATKISAFGIYWQNPIAATIGALDIHMIGLIGKKLLKEDRWKDKARGWYDDWRTIKSEAAKKHLEEVAESQLIKESTTNRAPGFRSIKNRAKQILNEQRKFRDSVSFEQFLEADKSNPGYTFWRDQLRTEITTPQRLQVHPVGVPEYRKAFPTKNIDSKKVRQIMADVKANTKLTPKQRADRVGKLENAIKAHEHIESAEKMFGSDHPIVDRFIKDLSREKDGTKYVEIMSPDYREVLESMARDVQERDVLGNVATRQHLVWDEWRGYLDPHVIVQPGSAMLPAVRPAALKSIIKSLESTFPEIKDPRVQADLTSRHSRLVSGLFGAGFRDLHSSLKEGGFGGTAPFEGRPLPTEMSKGALYMREGGPPSTPLNILISAGRDLSDLFNKGDASVLFKENSNALMYLMVEEFPEMMEVFTNKFDSIVGENGVTTLTGRGRAEVNDAFVDFWHSRHVDDPQVDMAFQGIKDKLSVFWRRIRHRADRTNPAVRRYFDEWLGVVNDAKKEAMFDVSNSAEFKSIPRVRLKESVLETEQVAKRGRAKEATRIDLDEGRIRYALELGDDVTEVDTFKTMQKAVEYVSREMSRQKYTNNWVSFSTRSIVPARMLARHLEEVQLRTYSVFGDPHALKKQMEKIPKERIKRDRFGDDVIDVSSMDNLPEREVATEMLPDGREVPTEIIVFNLTELQQGKLKSLLLELYADPRTKVPVRRVLGEYLGPNADLSVLPEAHYQFIVQEMIRDHVVGVGTGLTKEMNRVPKSLGYAAVQGVLGSAPFRAAGGDALVRMLKKQFKTRKPLAHIRRSKTGKETSADTEVLSPVVKELFMRRSRQIDDIPNWIRRVQKSLKDGRMASGVWETLEGLKEVLEQPISNQAYRILDNVEVYFDSQKGIRFDDLISRIDEIQIAFADNRLMLNAERKAFDLLREVDRIKKTQPERTVVRNGRVEIKDPVMREGIAEAYLVISEGVSRRLHMADNAVETIIVGMAGSPEAAQKIFNRRADVFTDRGQAISLYNLFYRGDWSEVLKRFAEQGYATGTATKYPGRYNLGHAMLETIIRLRAQSIFKGLLNDMTDMGMSVKIKDLAPPTIRSITEKRAFANRVKLYLNEEIKFGGVQHLVDEDGRIIHEGLQSRFEGPRFLPEAGGKVQGAGPGSSLLSKEARARLADLEGYRKTQATLGDVVTKVVVDDLEAYTVAQDLIEKWGMKYGSNIENWEIARFPDGSEALTPKLFSEEISDAVDRVAGTASARAGKSRLKLDGLMASDSRLVPEEGTPSLKGRAQRFKRDYLQSADVMNYMMNTLGWSYRMTKMGLTSGIFMVNLPYYVANAFGAQLQVYQKVGMRGYFSSMSHPVISLEVAASLWGRTPTMRFLEVKPVVTPDGSVWSREALTRACHEHGLSGSFLSMETARSIAVDLKKNEPSFWEKMSGETEYEKLPYKEVDYPGFAGIDLPGPVTALRFYHEQLINFATFIDNYHRVALFTEGVGRGLSPADAAKSARSALFDYSDLTAAEKKYMRQIFIFYSFQRKNLDLFWDTFLTNPHRIMGQFRLARGVNQVYLDGDETLIESDYSVGRLGLMFVKNSANRLVQKNRYNAPMLPAMEAIKGQLDFFSFVGSFIPTDDVILRQKRMKNQLKFMSRLNPWIQAPMAMTIQKSFFKGTRMRPERIPTFWAQHDILTNGGMLLRGVGGRVRPIESWEEQEFPGQTHVYEAAETMNWYLLQNIWHGPVPVMPMREDTPGTSWMGAVGEVIDYSPIGLALRSQPIKGFKEGTLGAAPAGRMIDSLNRFGRAGMIIPQMLDADLKYYKHLVASGKRGKLVDDSRLGEGEDFDQAMNALGFQIDPETGDIDFQQGPEGEPIRGARPRIGVDEGWKSVLFGVQQMPTEDAAILMHYYRTQRALTGAVGEVEAKTRDRPLDISDRYEPEGSD